MKIIVETHAYAPELNCALIGPTRTRVKTPGCTSIRQVREKLFRRLPMRGRHVTVATVYPDSHAWLNRRHSGMCNSVLQLGNFLKDVRQKLAPGFGASVQVSSRIIG